MKGRKRARARAEHFAPRMFYLGSPSPVPDKAELLEALRVAQVHFVSAGFPLPARLSADLLRLLCGWRRRLDRMAICSEVDAFARDGLPVARVAGREHRETAFEAVARCWRERGWADMSADNVERIYREMGAAERSRAEGEG